jgi:hypothetical protein
MSLSLNKKVLSPINKEGGEQDETETLMGNNRCILGSGATAYTSTGTGQQ